MGLEESSCYFPRVGDLPIANRADRIGGESHHSKGLAPERGELDFIAGSAFVDHDRGPNVSCLKSFLGKRLPQHDQIQFLDQ